MRLTSTFFRLPILIIPYVLSKRFISTTSRLCLSSILVHQVSCSYVCLVLLLFHTTPSSHPKLTFLTLNYLFIARKMFIPSLSFSHYWSKLPNTWRKSCHWSSSYQSTATRRVATRRGYNLAAFDLPLPFLLEWWYCCSTQQWFVW